MDFMPIEERRGKRAAYMREYNSRPGHRLKKQEIDRQCYHARVGQRRAYDRWRSLSPERKAAKTAASRKHREQNPETARAYSHEYYLRNKDKWVKKAAERRARVGWSDRSRWYTIKYVHGVTRQQFEAMLVAQGGTCGLCDGPPRGQHNQWHIDHDHATGIIRGLLCMRCNHAIERADNSSEWLVRAAEWVKRGKV